MSANSNRVIVINTIIKITACPHGVMIAESGDRKLQVMA